MATKRFTISKANQNGMGIIAVVFSILVTALMIGVVAMKLNFVNQNVAQTKRVAGTNSLVSTLLPILTEQSLCISKLLPPQSFNAVAAKADITTGAVPLPLSFGLNNPLTPTIGLAKPTYYPQFDMFVGEIYFSNAVSNAVNNTEKSRGALNGLTIYEGQVWAQTYLTNPDGSAGVPGQTLIANDFYVWTNGTNILACGIVKTPEQFCRDDLGGLNYVAGAAHPCVSPHYPCLPKHYFLGYTAAGAAQCAQTPANCPVAGQTIVSNGVGGTICKTVP